MLNDCSGVLYSMNQYLVHSVRILRIDFVQINPLCVPVSHCDEQREKASSLQIVLGLAVRLFKTSVLGILFKNTTFLDPESVFTKEN